VQLQLWDVQNRQGIHIKQDERLSPMISLQWMFRLCVLWCVTVDSCLKMEEECSSETLVWTCKSTMSDLARRRQPKAYSLDVVSPQVAKVSSTPRYEDTLHHWKSKQSGSVNIGRTCSHISIWNLCEHLSIRTKEGGGSVVKAYSMMVSALCHEIHHFITIPHQLLAPYEDRRFQSRNSTGIAKDNIQIKIGVIQWLCGSLPWNPPTYC
jgi:hypothetical protein